MCFVPEVFCFLSAPYFRRIEPNMISHFLVVLQDSTARDFDFANGQRLKSQSCKASFSVLFQTPYLIAWLTCGNKTVRPSLPLYLTSASSHFSQEDFKIVWLICRLSNLFLVSESLFLLSFCIFAAHIFPAVFLGCLWFSSIRFLHVCHLRQDV